MTPAARKILRRLAKHAKCFDLTADSLGEDLCKAAADGVIECIEGQHAPDGTSWPELSEGYAKAKSKKYPGKPMGVREGLMSAPDEVAGTVDVSPGEAVLTYGKSDEARAEAGYFQEGDPSRNRPPATVLGTDGAIHQGIEADSRRAVRPGDAIESPSRPSRHSGSSSGRSETPPRGRPGPSPSRPSS